LRRSHTRRMGCESQETSPARTAGRSSVCSLEIHQCSAALVHAALVFFRDTMKSEKGPVSARPIPNATRGHTGSGRQPPRPGQTITRLTPSHMMNNPIPRMVSADKIASVLTRPTFVPREFHSR